MGIFIIMYCMLLFIGRISKKLPKGDARKFVWISGFIVLWSIQALRATTVGTDLEGYLPDFLEIDTSYRAARYEPAYYYLNYIINHYISLNDNIFLAIVSLITLLPISILYRDFSKSLILSYIIFASFILYHFTFSGLRQGLALAFISISYKYIVNRKFFKFIIYVIIAALFHKSAIIFLTAYPLCNIVKMTKKKYLLSSIILAVSLYSLKGLLTIILPIIFGEYSFASYLDKGAKPAYNLLILLFLIFFSTFFVKQPSAELKNYRLMSYCATVCQSLGLFSSEATRIGYYFILFLPLLLPDLICELKVKKLTKSVIRTCVVIFMVAFFFYSNANGYLNVIPYSFFWE